jgi:hypothetical protein
MFTEVKGGYFRHSFINKNFANCCYFIIASYLGNNNDNNKNTTWI